MDLRKFYKSIRDVETTIADAFTLVTSLSTEDGGKGGVVSEVPRYQAARMIVEGRARLATAEERADYTERLEAALLAYQELEAAKRLPLATIVAQEFNKLNTKPKTSK